jgi:cyclopropane fatty-acyl-phospholipid synthase-like methyltransferase
MRCEEVDAFADGRLISPSADRNKGPILAVLERILPATGTVLEIASGTGQHVVHFARALRHLTWQPSDVEAECLRSISAWLSAERLPNIRQPIELDVQAFPWPVKAVDAIVCANLLHIAPWPVVPALFAGARAALRASGPLYLYGPYSLQGRHTAPSNAAFDRALRAYDPEWGVRDLAEVARVAEEHGLELAETAEMPANNLSVVFRRRGPAVS